MCLTVFRPFPKVEGGKWQLSTVGGCAPLWSRDGTELFFVDSSRTMNSASFAGAGSAPSIGAPRALFARAAELSLGTFYTSFDVSRDVKHFLMAQRLGKPRNVEAVTVVVQNFDEVVRAKGQRR